MAEANGPKPFILLGLAPGGVYLAADITATAGGLLHHRFTLTCAIAGSPQSRQYASLLHLPSSHLARLLAGTVLCGVRTFLSQRSQRNRQPRSPGLLGSLIVTGSGKESK